jgi:hypothetical protein
VRGQTDFVAFTLVGETFNELANDPKIPGQCGLLELYKRRTARRLHGAGRLTVFEQWRRWYGDDMPDMLRAQAAEDKRKQKRIMMKVVNRIAGIFASVVSQYQTPLTWNRLNPMTQFTGSFHPIKEHARVFYDDDPLYRETLVGLSSRELAFAIRQVFRIARFPVDLQNHIVRNYIIPVDVDRRLRLFKATLPPVFTFRHQGPSRVDEHVDFRPLDFNSEAKWDASEFLANEPVIARQENMEMQMLELENFMAGISSFRDPE